MTLRLATNLHMHGMHRHILEVQILHRTVTLSQKGNAS